MALRNIDDLFEMLPASASIQGPLSIGCPHGSFRSTFNIYERALVIACPILLLLRVIAAFRPNEVRRSDYSQTASEVTNAGSDRSRLFLYVAEDDVYLLPSG